MTRKAIRWLGSLAAAAISSQAMAGQQVGKVSELWVHPGVVDVKLAGPDGSRAACAADTYWQFDPSTPAGTRWLSIFLTAQASGQTIMIAGTGGCGTTFQREQVAYIRITN